MALVAGLPAHPKILCMDEQHDTDNSSNPTEAAPGPNDRPRAPAGREMLIQLQQMIDNVAYQAAPVVREVAAKAAELAAVAGTKAGPLAHRAAGATEQFGQRVAARSKEMAADLRRPRDDNEPPADAGASNAADAVSNSDVGQSESTGPGPGESTDQF